MTPAVSYIRWSTPHQTEGSSLYRQSERLETFCKVHNLQLIERIRDEGLSAFTGKNKQRGNLATFLRAVEEGLLPDGCWLIIDDISRLTRQELDTSQELVRQLLRAGITIALLSSGRILRPECINDLGSSLQLLVELHTAYNESRIKSDRAKGAWGKARKDLESDSLNKPLPGVCPAWLKKQGNQYVVDPAKAEVVRQIFSLYVEGKGAYAIAKHLNESGVTTLGKGKKWATAGVSSLLKNKAVIGIYSPNTTHYKNGSKKLIPTGEEYSLYPPIISEALFYQAQHIRLDRSSSVTKSNAKPFRNILQGVGFCVCGARMRIVVQGRGKYSYYLPLCENYGRECSHRKCLPLSAVERSLFDALCSESVIRSFLRHSQSVSDSGAIGRYTLELKQAENRLQELSEALLTATPNTVKATVDVMNKLQTEVDDIKHRIEQLKASEADKKSINLSSDYHFILSLMTGNQLSIEAGGTCIKINQLFKRHFSKIVIDAKGGRLWLHLKHSNDVIEHGIYKKPEGFSLKPYRELVFSLIKDEVV